MRKQLGARLPSGLRPAQWGWGRSGAPAGAGGPAGTATTAGLLGFPGLDGCWISCPQLPSVSRIARGVVYGPDGCGDNVGPGTRHCALWARRGPFPGSVPEGGIG